MPSTSDLFAQALQDFARKGGTPSSATALANFDPMAALQTYGKGVAGQFKSTFDQSLSDLRGRSVGAGRLNTGFYDQDTGRLAQTVGGQYTQQLEEGALSAAGLKESALGTSAGIEEEEQNRYLDLLSGQMDRDTAAQNARQQQQGGLLSGLGSLYGGLGAAAILASSKRFKDDVEPIAGASERLDRMPGVSFKYKGSDQPQLGVLAEDAAQAAPEAVQNDEQGRPMAVDYIKLLPVVIEATREQAGELEAIKGELAELRRIAGGGMIGQPMRRAA